MEIVCQVRDRSGGGGEGWGRVKRGGYGRGFHEKDGGRDGVAGGRRFKWPNRDETGRKYFECPGYLGDWSLLGERTADDGNQEGNSQDRPNVGRELFGCDERKCRGVAPLGLGRLL